MKRRLFNLTTLVFRLLAIAMLLSIPVTSVVLCTVGLLTRQYVHLFGKNIVGETSLNYVWLDGGILFEYSTGWQGAPAARGHLFDVPGLWVDRTIVTLTGATSGDAILGVRIQWWLLLIGNIPPLLPAFLLARPLLPRRRVGLGCCPACGYDLRATPDCCPECGTVPEGSSTTAE